MAASSDVSFSSKLSTLEQINSDFPFIVTTRDKIASFMNIPTEKEGKMLFLEKEMKVKYARIKVLPFHDYKKESTRRSVDEIRVHNSYIGEEFYIPIDCPGSLKVVPYPGKRQRYTTVTEIMKDNPRYLKSTGDIITITPSDLEEEHKSTKCVSSGTVLESKAIVHHTDGRRYLKCVDSNDVSYLLSENLHVNFTAPQDVNDYFLKELTTSRILLPTSVQFNPGTISPIDVAFFDDCMASDALVIISGPLEIQSVVTLSVLVAKLRESQRLCFKTAVMTKGLSKKFHVHEGNFQSPEKKSTFIERKFGGCIGDNEFVVKALYLLPVAENFVAWIRSRKQIYGRVQFCDSSDSDGDYEIPEEPPEPIPRPPPPIPPIPDRIPLQTQDNMELDEHLSALHTVTLLPTAKVRDHDAVSKLKQKAKLGFGFVHEELRRIIQQKHKQKSIKLSKSVDTKKPHTSTQIGESLNRSQSVHEQSITQGSALDEYDVKCVNTNRPLPPLPRRTEKSKSFDEGIAHEQSNYDYVDMTGKLQDEQEEPVIEQRPLAFVRPIGHTAPQQGREYVDARLPNPPPALTKHFDPYDEDDGDYLEPVFQEPQDETENEYEIENQDEVLETSPNLPFFCYSVKETVECLRTCGLMDLADVCEEQKLDGEFFKNTDEGTLTELLALSRLSIFKLKLIYKGWRPKY